MFDLLTVCDDHGLRLPNLGGGKPDVDRQVYVWSKPELGLTVGVGDVHVDARLFPGKEEQSELPVANDRRRHRGTLSDGFHKTEL
jgi:hypothetical protein